MSPPIITAAVAEPGMPSESMGKSALVPAAWSAVSGATMPSGSPRPESVEADDSAPRSPVGSEAGLRPTALQRVRQLRTTQPDLTLKPREWSALLGVSAREINRAIDAGALPFTAKDDGRDHGAKLVHIDHMEAFLATVEAIERGSMDPTAWWTDVRGPKAWARRPRRIRKTIRT